MIEWKFFYFFHLSKKLAIQDRYKLNYFLGVFLVLIIQTTIYVVQCVGGPLGGKSIAKGVVQEIEIGAKRKEDEKLAELEKVRIREEIIAEEMAVMQKNPAIALEKYKVNSTKNSS